jgi:hypothetical protein
MENFEDEKNELLRGEWFLPGCTKSFPGVLTSSGGSFSLKVFGNEYLNGEDPKDINNPRNTDFQIILGICRQSGFVTLYNCEWRGTKDLGKELCEFKYSVYAVFEGAHVAKEEYFHIKSASTHFPFVDTWYDGWESMGKTKKALKRGQNHDEKTVKIDDNLTLKYIDYYAHHDYLDGHLTEIKYSKWVDFEYEQPVSFDRALRDWVKFQRMLEFTTMGKEVNFTISLLQLATRDISFDETHTGKSDYTAVRVQYNHLSKEEPAKRPYVHQNRMLFSRWKVSSEQLNQITRQWFANEKYYTVYDYYLDSDNWYHGSGVQLSNVMFNNRFLNLIQGLESYHYLLNEQFIPENDLFTRNRQAVLNLIDDKSLKKWLHNTLKFPKEHSLLDRLDALIVRFRPYLEKLVGNLESVQSFSVESKDLRNLLSHGRHDSTFLGDRVNSNYFIAKILLCFCVLESLKIDPSTIIRITELNYELRKYSHEVIYHHQRKCSL